MSFPLNSRGVVSPMRWNSRVCRIRSSLTLDRRVDLADLVEEHGAHGGARLEPAHAVLDRPGEGALPVTEQLRLDEGRRQGRDVEGVERAVDRKARFEQTAERHAGLSEFADSVGELPSACSSTNFILLPNTMRPDAVVVSTCAPWPAEHPQAPTAAGRQVLHGVD